MKKRIFEDTFNMLCGALISDAGAFRQVFECKLRPDLVAKVERNSEMPSCANIFEQYFWDTNKDDPRIALLRKTVSSQVSGLERFQCSDSN